jgi:dipeptidyl aminopeptidase/acylaminoacyl peptidase
MLSLALATPAQTPPATPVPLTVTELMRGPGLYGYAPRQLRWSGDGQRVYFEWKQYSDPLIKEFDTWVVSRDGSGLRKLNEEEAKLSPPAVGAESEDRSLAVYSGDGDLSVHDRRTGTRRLLMKTRDAEADPRFTRDGSKVVFTRSGNLFTFRLSDGFVEQLTDIRPAGSPSTEPKKGTASQEALKKEERSLLTAVDEMAKKREEREAKEKKENPRKPWIPQGRQRVARLQLSPDEKTVVAMVEEPAADAKRAQVAFPVTESGYTEPRPTRAKAGEAQDKSRMALLSVATGELKWADHGLKVKDDNGKETPREVYWRRSEFSQDGKLAVQARSADNKDRWVLLVDTKTGASKVIDHQHDDAWVSGPGTRMLGWLADNKTVYFLSEKTGWSQLYAGNVETGEVKQLTSGRGEVFDAELTRDKKRFRMVTSFGSLAERQINEMAVEGGALMRVAAEPGRVEEYAAPPDESMLALVHSYSNRPPELFLMENAPAGRMKRVTTSPAPEFLARKWLDTPIVYIPARDGAKIPAHIYKPSNAKKGAPAVVFVHGAGYLQNVHRGWSQYAREYLFHHLLMERGYIVIDIDYRGSAGYGRDWRTAIYRYMGGKDLDDHIDAARWLVSEHGVDPARIGIYGGSYGGFITLMAMFTQPGVFAAGAALRPVTDWAHYTHGYTTDILNAPQTDLEAYKKSSPIYHAAGLTGALLICHGMVDVNVHFQDTVRLAQKLIELGKQNWEVAMYPVEDHAFVQPASWADEYRRILKLFEENLNARATASVGPKR